MFALRAARAGDQPVIVRMVRAAHINPTGIAWSRFVVAEAAGEIIGIGQIKLHRGSTRELASIATAKAWQGKGVATAVIKHLLDATPRPVHLFCEGALVPFYTRFGFVELADPDIPRDLFEEIRWPRRLGWLAGTIVRKPLRLAVMALE